MCALPDRDESDSSGEIDVDYFDFEEPVGWNANLQLSNYIKNNSAEQILIRLADEKFPLEYFIHKFSIDFKQRYSPSGWTYQARCPFKDHRDTTPSFGYNPKAGLFKCFGCGRAGKTVAFLSFLDGRPQIEVAQTLLEKVSDTEELILQLEERSESKIDSMLYNFSVEVHAFLKKNASDEAIIFSERITEALDVYLAKNILKNNINPEHLQTRLSKLTLLLNRFGETNK